MLRIVASGLSSRIIRLACNRGAATTVSSTIVRPASTKAARLVTAHMEQDDDDQLQHTEAASFLASEDAEADSAAPEPEQLEEDEQGRLLLPLAPGEAHKPTGVFADLPQVPPYDDVLHSGEQKIKKITILSKNRRALTPLEGYRQWSLEQIVAFSKKLHDPVAEWVSKAPTKLSTMHPFERALVRLTLAQGEYSYLRVIRAVKSLCGALLHATEKARADIKKAPNMRTLKVAREQGLKRIRDAWKENAIWVERMRAMYVKLRSLNRMEARLPLVVLVGAPNVGKSSIVRAISTGNPEVQNYPFTTRSLLLGHIMHDGPYGALSIQVTDTPGLLPRADPDRVKVELLTLAALQHLKPLVLYVIDKSQHCGTSLEDQERIRDELRARFPDLPWIDVASKADLSPLSFTIMHKPRPPMLPATESAFATYIRSARTSEPLPLLTFREPGDSALEHNNHTLIPDLPPELPISTETQEGLGPLQIAIIWHFLERIKVPRDDWPSDLRALVESGKVFAVKKRKPQRVITPRTTDAATEEDL